MNTVNIPLHSKKYPGLTAMVDAADAASVSAYRWYPRCGRSGVYAITNIDGKTVYMHRMIVNAGKGEYVDHINHSQLDNRRENLRVVGNAENQVNRAGLRSDNKTGYVGVYRVGNYWYGNVWHDGKKLTQSGKFSDPADAARARDRKVIELYGRDSYLNFPEEAA